MNYLIKFWKNLTGHYEIIIYSNLLKQEISFHRRDFWKSEAMKAANIYLNTPGFPKVYLRKPCGERIELHKPDTQKTKTWNF